MTLPKEVKDWLRTFFPGAFADSLELDLNESKPTVAVVDFMQFVKHIPTKDSFAIRAQLVDYFVKRAVEVLMMHPSIEDLIIMVDGSPMAAKRAVAHRKRHAKDAPLSTTGGPYIPPRDHDPIMNPEKWKLFAKNFLLLRRELYPLLFNSLMQTRGFKLRVGQRIILSGFPGRSGWQTVHSTAPWEALHNNQNRQWAVKLWEDLPITEAMERADPQLYSRTYVVEQRQEGPVWFEWEAAINDISEADIRMFWFAHFYRNRHVLFYLNDGDVFSIGLLAAQERLHSISSSERAYVFYNRHSVMMPVLGGKDAEEDDAPARKRFYYVNLNKFYSLVREFEPLRKARVHSPVATIVLLITLAGCDFFEKFLLGMGFGSIIWNTFLSNIAFLTHIVMIPDAKLPVLSESRVYRQVVINERAFACLVRLCFAAMYRKDLDAKRLKRTPSVKDISIRASQTAKGEPRADERYHFPEQNETRAYARAVLWVLEYWKNGVAGFVPDCMDRWHGLPYYPYWVNPKTHEPEFLKLVCPYSKPVDDVFARCHAQVEVCASSDQGRELLRRAQELHDFNKAFMIAPRLDPSVFCRIAPNE